VVFSVVTFTVTWFLLMRYIVVRFGPPVPCCFPHCIMHNLTLMPYPAEPFNWDTHLSNDCLDVGADGQDMLSNY